MNLDLQKASLWKRISAGLFDGILLAVLAVGFGLLLSALLGYDNYNQTVLESYAKYESQYGIVFDITQEQYNAMTSVELENYNAAYDALLADDAAMHAYNMVVSLSLMISSIGILLSFLVLEFLIPLMFKNGQTLGKKTFGIGVMRIDGVQITPLHLFVRTVLGKYTIETMIPVLVIMMIFFGTVGLPGTLLLLALAVAQAAALIVTKNNSLLHDLLAGTVTVDFTSQMIFRTTEDLINYQKQVAADRASRSPY